MASNNTRLPQPTTYTTIVGRNTETTRPTTVVPPETKATAAGPQHDLSFLEDIEKQLLRGGDTLDRSTLKPKERHTDIMSQSMIIPGPNIVGRSLHEQSATFKADAFKEAEEVQVPSSVSLSGTTVEIGDVSRPRDQPKRQIQEEMNAAINPQVDDILSTFDQTQMYRDTPQGPQAVQHGSELAPYQVPLSSAKDGGLQVDISRSKKFEVAANKDVDKNARKKTQPVNPSPRMPVEELITSSEMAFTYKDLEKLSADPPRSTEHGTPRPRSGTETEFLQGTTMAVVRKSSGNDDVATVVPGACSGTGPGPTEREKKHPAGNGQAKAPPSSLPLKTDNKQPQSWDGQATERHSKGKRETHSVLQTARQFVKPNAKTENSASNDNLKQSEATKAKGAVTSRSSSASRDKANVLKRTNQNQAADTTEGQALQLSSSQTEGSTYRKLISEKPSVSEVSRQKQFVREVEERLNTSLRQKVKAEVTRRSPRSASLRRAPASPHAGLNHKGTNDLSKRVPPKTDKGNLNDEARTDVSRTTPQRPMSASVSQRPASKSLSPSKTNRSRPSSATFLTSPDKGHDKPGRHTEVRAETLSKHSCVVTVGQTRVTARSLSESGPKSAPAKTKEPKNAKSGCAASRTSSLTRRAPMDIFEERASSKGWVSCINTNNSILNQKIPLSPVKNVSYHHVERRSKNISQYKKTEK